MAPHTSIFKNTKIGETKLSKSHKRIIKQQKQIKKQKNEENQHSTPYRFVPEGEQAFMNLISTIIHQEQQDQESWLFDAGQSCAGESLCNSFDENCITGDWEEAI